MDWLGLIVGIFCFLIGIPFIVYFVKALIKIPYDFSAVMSSVFLGAIGFFVGGWGLMVTIITILKAIK